MIRIHCVLAIVSIAIPLGAQTAGTQQNRTGVSSIDNTGNLPAQKLGPNDLIGVSVYDAPELTRTVRVSADGYIRLPMLKERIKAQGLMPAEMETAISAELQQEGILVEPVVTVTIAEYNSRPISVMGSVKAPMTFQATGPINLLDALARAGGLAPDAGLEILVTKTEPGSDGTPTSLTQRVPVRGLIDRAEPQYNIALHGGEEIRVPEIGKMFVVGNIKKPGAYPVQDGGETTVLEMLALGEGLEPYASKFAYIYRREAQGAKNEIPVELRKLIDRKTPDVQLQANDILYIPDNRSRRTTMAVLEKILEFRGWDGFRRDYL